MNQQSKLFYIKPNKKSYRAFRHDIVRKRQSSYCNTAHSPDKKINQIKNVLPKICGKKAVTTLELFAGQGTLTKIYAEYGAVLANEKKNEVFDKLRKNIKGFTQVQCNRVDSFIDFHRLIATKQIFDVIDLDPYGFPNRMFPDVFLLIKKGVMFITMPKPYVNILNGITQVHLESYFGEQNPSMETIIERIALWGLCHWRKVQLVHCIELKSVWRFAFSVEKVKSTEYTNTKNR